MNPTKLIRSIFAKRLSQIDRYADYGDIIQQKTLLDLLQKAKNVIEVKDAPATAPVRNTALDKVAQASQKQFQWSLGF